MDNDQVRQVRQYSRSLAREWKLVANRACSEGLSVSEAHSLIELSTVESFSVQEVADLLLIDKSNASRALKALGNQGFVEFRASNADRRAKKVFITDAGRKQVTQVHAEADEQVGCALGMLGVREREIVELGLQTYAKALRYCRLQEGFSIRPIVAEDDPAVARVIRLVSEEYGLRAEDGYAVGDPSVDHMSSAYADKGGCYWVVESKGRVVGGGGVAALQGGDGHVCELQKMYYTSECRGRGLGRKLVLMALEFARSFGYEACYLETTGELREAISLYEALGFERQKDLLGDTGHEVCELRYLYRFG
ncbi:helix-turn-helix domain-containing GNAT family N-acetyltransferase [Maridesulfovibrio sp.]|uniref:bifunctional helix-turn-helix transcriptional regulator/GNAT family N-acetyltransferase n=1 Tax=Maridesulfovibrio sp. TaxID=2795000 RepID=UPI002A18A331|nr:helix-turn-helix domain-containing GNAT family N-acetyltransferase [Maridesulfovibrio sp.]